MKPRGILTAKDDPLNHIRRQDDFLNAMRGLKHADIIRAAVRAKKNILVVGSTGSGKTTFVNACLDALADLTPHDRVISIEDTTELQCPVKNYLDLRAVGNVTMLECLRACMRLKPTRIVVGEVRGAEAHTLLKAWNTGHPGGMATVHANDAMSGLIRLESLVAEATNAPQQTLIAEAVDLVIFVDEEPELRGRPQSQRAFARNRVLRWEIRGRARLESREDKGIWRFKLMQRITEFKPFGPCFAGSRPCCTLRIGLQPAGFTPPRRATCRGSARCKPSRLRSPGRWHTRSA